MSSCNLQTPSGLNRSTDTAVVDYQLGGCIEGCMEGCMEGWPAEARPLSGVHQMQIG